MGKIKDKVFRGTAQEARMKVKFTERGIERYSELDDGALGVTVNFVPYWAGEEQLLNPKAIEPPVEVRVPRGASGSLDIEPFDGLTYESWLGFIRAELMRDSEHWFNDINEGGALC